MIDAWMVLLRLQFLEAEFPSSIGIEPRLPRSQLRLVLEEFLAQGWEACRELSSDSSAGDTVVKAYPNWLYDHVYHYVYHIYIYVSSTCVYIYIYTYIYIYIYIYMYMLHVYHIYVYMLHVYHIWQSATCVASSAQPLPRWTMLRPTLLRPLRLGSRDPRQRPRASYLGNGVDARASASDPWISCEDVMLKIVFFS